MKIISGHDELGTKELHQQLTLTVNTHNRFTKIRLPQILCKDFASFVSTVIGGKTKSNESSFRV